MRKQLFAAALTLAATNSALADGQIITPRSAMQFQQGPAENFSGKAEFARFPQIPGSPDRSAIVHFAPGTVTNWHTHSHGQYLVVTEGEGRTQEWGKLIQIIRKGDVVWCPPGVKHWHGAGEHTAMSHLAISPKAAENKVAWLERPELPQTAAAPALARQQGPLRAQQLAIVPIAALSATGDLTRLKPAIAAGLDSGLTINEIREVFAHQYAYAGFPRALNGLTTLAAVLKERQARGVRDPQGKEATAVDSPDYYAIGTRNLADLSKRPNDGKPLYDFAGIDYALKAHLFGYLFSRDSLAPASRQLVTIATLAALGNVNPQLASHLKNTQNLGVDAAGLNKVFEALEHEVGPHVADNARKVLADSR